jgi:hypothetical protein
MRRLSLLSLLALAAAPAACGGDSTGPVDPVGAWALRDVDGVRPPVLYLADAAAHDTMYLTGFELTLRSDGTFTGSLTVRPIMYGSAQDLTGGLGGSWSQSGSAITFSGDPLLGAAPGQLSGRAMLTRIDLDVDDQLDRVTFRKR